MYIDIDFYEKFLSFS